MKKFTLLVLFTAFLLSAKAQFGFYASAVYLSANGTAQYFNNNPTSPDPNAIGTSNYQGSDLGTFAQNTSALTINGGQMKTYKNNSGDICAVTLYYMVYPVGNRPATTTFQPIVFGFQENCSGGVFAAGEACSSGDQKWGTTAQNIDLTNYAIGTYTLEIFYQVNGSNDGNCGDASAYDNNNNNATNYTANFTITTPLPVVLQSFSGTKQNNNVVLNWTDIEEINSNGFGVERSTDGKNFVSIGWADSKGSNKNTYSFTDNNIPGVSKVFYRLQMKNDNGSAVYSYIVSVAVNGNSVPVTVQSVSGNISARIINLPVGNYAAKVYSINGMLMGTQNIEAATGAETKNIQMTINGLSKGQFVLVLRNAAGTLVSKVNFINQ